MPVPTSLDHNIEDIVQSMQRMVAADWQTMERVMAEQLAGVDLDHLPLLPEIANHLLLAGGKRLRPLLCLMAEQLLLPQQQQNPAQPPAQIHGGINPMVYLAAAVEFIHGATLLHDDVIDKAILRRGKKTANNIWGNHLPVLVGDFLFARAFQLMVMVNNTGVLSTLAQTAATLSMGEVWQLSHQLHYQEKFLTLEDYEKIIFAKTGSLFAASFVVAGLLGDSNKTSPTNLALQNLGAGIGMIFQLVDDGLDYFGDPVKTKKDIGVDFFEGKITLPILLLYHQAKTDAAVIKKLDSYFVAKPESAPAKTKDDLAWLMAQLYRFDIATLANKHIEQFVGRVVKQLDFFANSPARDLLREFTRASYQRQW